MSIGVMKDKKLKLRDLHASHTLVAINALLFAFTLSPFFFFFPSKAFWFTIYIYDNKCISVATNWISKGIAGG
jgi:hypothetical protein